MNPGTSVCNITFLNQGNQMISGTGVVTSFNTISPNMGTSISNTLEVTSSNFSAPADFLKLSNGVGTFKFSVPAAAVTLDAFSVATLIPPNCAIWMNSPNSIFNCHSTLTFRGDFTCSAGTVNVGDVANESLVSNGALFTITGGTVNVAGRLSRPSYVAITNFVMSGGKLVLNTISSNDNTPAGGTVAAPPFCIDVAGSNFNMTGGTIVIRNTGSGATSNYAYSNLNCSNYTFSGGTLQIGDALTSSAGQTFHLLTDNPIKNLLVDNSTNTKIASIFNMYSGAACTLNVTGTVNINSGSTLISNNNDLLIGGSLVNNGTYTPGSNTTTFNGAAAQTVSGTTATTLNNMTMNNTSGGLTLNKPLTVSNTLTLTSGLVYTDAVNLLILNNGAISTGGSMSSYVSGPMAKIGNSAFVFPLGKGGVWARVGITAPATASNQVTAEYFNAAYGNIVSVNAPLTNVSNNEYWTLGESIPGDAVSITLYWESALNSNILTYDNTLRVAHFNGASWDDIGQSAIAAASPGNVTSGSISSFSPFTFGSTIYGSNPLPIEMLSFQALLNSEEQVNLNWSTATETNNDYFTVERSSNQVDFNPLCRVKGAGNSSSLMKYSALDPEPLDGKSYYRLKQTDFNGAVTYTAAVSVQVESPMRLSIYPNPASDLQPANLHMTLWSDNSVLVVVCDLDGQELYSKIMPVDLGTETVVAVDPEHRLKPGLYLIRATSSNSICKRKLIIR
jgi:hypothetical protein